MTLFSITEIKGPHFSSFDVEITVSMLIDFINRNNLTELETKDKDFHWENFTIKIWCLEWNKIFSLTLERNKTIDLITDLAGKLTEPNDVYLEDKRTMSEKLRHLADVLDQTGIES